jgi:hypothetical protein
MSIHVFLYPKFHQVPQILWIFVVIKTLKTRHGFAGGGAE